MDSHRVHPYDDGGGGSGSGSWNRVAAAATTAGERVRVPAPDDGGAGERVEDGGRGDGVRAPAEAAGSAMSVFDTVHLAFDVAGMSGSVCVQAAAGDGGGGEKAPRPTRRRGSAVTRRCCGWWAARATCVRRGRDGVLRACSAAAVRWRGRGEGVAA